MYLPPPATAITLAIASRRLVKQPVAAALDFYLGGSLRPPLAPAIRTAIASGWQGLAQVRDSQLTLTRGLLHATDQGDALPFGQASPLGQPLAAPLTQARAVDLTQAGRWVLATRQDSRLWQGLAMSTTCDPQPLRGVWQQAAQRLDLARTGP